MKTKLLICFLISAFCVSHSINAILERIAIVYVFSGLISQFVSSSRHNQEIPTQETWKGEQLQEASNVLKDRNKHLEELLQLKRSQNSTRQAGAPEIDPTLVQEQERAPLPGEFSRRPHESDLKIEEL
mgnify:CR=1 FL=1